MERRRQPSSGSETSNDSSTAVSLDQVTTSLETISDLNKRLESSLNANKNPESKLVEEPLKEQCNTSNSIDIKKNIAEILSEISILKEIESGCQESNSRKVQTPCMKLTKDQPFFSSTETFLDLNTAENSDQVTTSLQRKSDLNKIFESSLNINKNPESNLEEDKSKRQDDSSQPSCIRKGETDLLSKKPNLKDTDSSFDESSASMDQNCKYTETANNVTSLVSKNFDNTKLDVKSEKPVSFSRHRETVLPIKRNLLDANAKSFHPGYPHMVNPAFSHRNISPGIQNQASANPERSFDDSKDHHYQNQTFHSALNQNKTYMNRFSLPYSQGMQSLQRQVPPRIIARPVRLSPSCTRTSYPNPFPPIKTNAKPVRHVGGPSNPNPMPPIRTNANPVRFVKNSKRFENPMSPFRNNATPMQHFQPSRQLVPTNSDRLKFSPDVTRSTTDLSANQPQLSRAENQSNSIPNLEQSEKVTKLEELSKRAHYSKKNMLSIDIPTKITPEPYLPLNAISQGFIPPMQSQPIPIQFPTPSGSCYFGANFSGVRRIVPNVRHQSAGYNDPSNVYSYFNPIVLPQYQPVMQNLTEISQYEDPNIPIYQYVTHNIPISQNIRADSQYNDPNFPMRQLVTQNQLRLRNRESVLQYQDPNRHLHQYGSQYHDPNIMYRVRTQSSSDDFNSIDTRSRPTYVANIPSQYYNPNLLPMQTFAANPTFTGMVSNPLCSFGSEQSYFNNVQPNFSALPTFAQNTSSAGTSLNPPGFYSINEQTNNSWISDPNQQSTYYQDHVPISNPDLIQANVYNSSPVSTNDSNEGTPVYYPDETSTNQ